MTREEAIEVIQQDIPCEHDKDLIEALDMAISALSAIEDIKAEINKLDDLNPDYPMDRTVHISKWAVMEIIDKHIRG